jgi:hypothetical protein
MHGTPSKTTITNKTRPAGSFSSSYSHGRAAIPVRCSILYLFCGNYCGGCAGGQFRDVELEITRTLWIKDIPPSGRDVSLIRRHVYTHIQILHAYRVRLRKIVVSVF